MSLLNGTEEKIYSIKQIAHIQSGFESKFAIPRQAGLAESLKARVVFEPEYKNPDAIRGLETFSHLWLIWCFSESVTDAFQPTVRPPRLGGNTRMGVFATRSPFRPNPIGLSCVKLEGVDNGDLIVSGADLMDGTPIFDIKPYIPYADCRTEATEGFAPCPSEKLEVVFACEYPEELKQELTEILSLDPRPRYQDEPERVYGFGYAGYEISFKVEKDLLTVIKIIKNKR